MKLGYIVTIMISSVFALPGRGGTSDAEMERQSQRHADEMEARALRAFLPPCESERKIDPADAEFWIGPIDADNGDDSSDRRERVHRDN
jgi:hypothetical protein